MDGLKVWLKLRATFNGETNFLHQTMQYLKHLERPYSPNIRGGMLGYIDQILHILNHLDAADPNCIHHIRYNDQQKMSLILRRFSDVEPYARITYDYYMQMAATNTYDVEKYVDAITQLCHHIDPHGANLAPFRAYMPETDIGTVQVHYSGQANNRPSYQGSPGPAMQPTGYHNFMFLTKPEFEHMKTNHADLHNRLRNIRVEVATALVTIRGPLPPGIAKLLD
jgi:hypothetical protein